MLIIITRMDHRSWRPFAPDSNDVIFIYIQHDDTTECPTMLLRIQYTCLALISLLPTLSLGRNCLAVLDALCLVRPAGSQTSRKLEVPKHRAGPSSQSNKAVF